MMILNSKVISLMLQSGYHAAIIDGRKYLIRGEEKIQYVSIN
jgi:hypothetical protein